MNAVVATGTLWNACFRAGTASHCLSKGLGAPIGSMLVGGADFIARSHRWRKMFGGGMRQVGIVAAAGLHALDHHVDRMAEDHAALDGSLRPLHAPAREGRCGGRRDEHGVFRRGRLVGPRHAGSPAAHGIDVLTLNDSTRRMVLHLHVTDEDVEQVLGAIAAVS